MFCFVFVANLGFETLRAGLRMSTEKGVVLLSFMAFGDGGADMEDDACAEETVDDA